MSVGWPTSVVTTHAVCGTFSAVSSCASHSSAHPVSGPYFDHGAICTNRNGNWPSCQWSRQSLIMAGNSVRYCSARPTFDSPWYQMTPLMA